MAGRPLKVPSLANLSTRPELDRDVAEEILRIVAESDCGSLPAPCWAGPEFRALCRDDLFWKDLCEAKGWYSEGTKPLFDEELAKQTLTFYRDQAVDEDKRTLVHWDWFATSSLKWKREFLFRCTFLSTPNACLGPFLGADQRESIRPAGVQGLSEAGLTIFRKLIDGRPCVDMALFNQRTKKTDRRPFLKFSSRTLEIDNSHTLVLPNGVTRLHGFFATGADGLTAVLNTGSLTSIGLNAFYKCVNLVTLDLSKGLKTIGRFAFNNCHNLALTALPEDLEEIGYAAFAHCRSLALTKLPKSLRSIGAGAFFDCQSLKLTELPRSLKFVGANAFDDCSERVQQAERDWRKSLP